jgi:UDP-N-acetyl-D-galactosamine dehydrogenase
MLDIDTSDVLEAAGTKWNFLKFKPGLVGGHCIGVDPFYLAQKSQESGYHPEIILAGRRLNDSMGEYVATQVVKQMIKKGINVYGAKVLLLGFTFKENCPDVRNTKIIDVILGLEDYHINVTTFDPWANPIEVKHEYNIETLQTLPKERYDAIVLGVAHKEFLALDLDLLKNENAVVYDVKGIFDRDKIDGRL